eukprot:scaffold139_cov325-Pavlova_lutheri.AAC.12
MASSTPPGASTKEEELQSGRLALVVGNSVRVAPAERASGSAGGGYLYCCFVQARDEDVHLERVVRKVQFLFGRSKQWEDAQVHEPPYEASTLGDAHAQTEVRIRVVFRSRLGRDAFELDHSITLWPRRGASMAMKNVGSSWIANQKELMVPFPAPERLVQMLQDQRMSSRGKELQIPKSRESVGRKSLDTALFRERIHSREEEDPSPPTTNTTPSEGGPSSRELQDLLHAAEELSMGSPRAKDAILEVKLLPGLEIDYSSLAFADPRERIGIGGYGEVLKANWRGTTVAVKELLATNPSQDEINDFCREVSILSQIRHPSILLWMGACIKPPKLAIVMEYMCMGSLYSVLHEKKIKVDAARKKKWSYAICKGMQYLHESTPPILHRDLSSNNVLIDQRGFAKISDFGLAKVKFNSRTRSGKGGTYRYAAPEVLRCEAHDEKADVYSFAVIVWELVMQEIPWRNLLDAQVVYMVSYKGRQLPVEHLTDPMQSLLLSCWNAVPSKRPTFAEVTACLERMSIEDFGPCKRAEVVLSSQSSNPDVHVPETASTV